MTDWNKQPNNTPALSFTFENTSLRIVERDGEPWFVAKDVATALGYGDTDQAIRNHCKKGKILKPVEATGLEIGPRGAVIIPEGDVYRLIARSKLPSAVAFEEKVFEEILPSIRKTGGYQADAAAKTASTDPAKTYKEMRLQDKFLRRYAQDAGLEGAQATLAVDQAMTKMFGVGPLGLMGVTHLTAPQNEQLLTPTDIAERMKLPSPRRVNALLTEYEFQVSDRDAKDRIFYEPTEKGRQAGGVMQDTGKKRGDGAPVRQLRWASSIVDALLQAMAADGGEPEAI